jgi:methionine transaminase
MLQIQSKLPNVGTTIFTVMSAAAIEHNAVNLAQGFPNFTPDARLLDLITHHMHNGANQYAPMAGHPGLRKRLSEKVELLYGRHINADTEITITAGGTQALFCAFAAFVRPGDEVILLEPCYDSYKPSIEAMGGKVIPFALTAPDFQVNWDAVEQLVTERTRIICTNTPGNPSGKTLTEYDLARLSRLTQGTHILVLSDEVYEHLIYDGRQHESVLKYDDLYQRSLSVFSFGKSYHATGWKVGYCIGPEYLMREFRKVHQFNVFSVHHPTQAALADYIGDTGSYDYLSAFYQAKRDYFLEAMHGSRFIPLVTEGSYFQLFDYSVIAPDMPDTEFALWLTREHGVATIPVSVFYTDAPKGQTLVRMCFAKNEETLMDAAKRLVQV